MTARRRRARRAGGIPPRARPFVVPAAAFLALFAVGLALGAAAGRPPGPSGWRDEVARRCAEHNVNPDLALAVIDAESSGRPRAESPAGALGLMQLMPETAADVAGELGLPEPSREDLFDPGLNIRLGVRYLGRLRASFGDERAFVIAAYHAGPTSVERWRQARQSVPAGRVVDEEAGPATRAYVAKVLARWRRAAGD